MFDSIGWGEIIVLALAALFIFGPERLPDLAKDAAAGLKRVRAAMTGVREQVNESLGDDLPELRDLDLRKYHPKTFIRSQLLGDDDDPDGAGERRRGRRRAGRPAARPRDAAPVRPRRDVGLASRRVVRCRGPAPTPGARTTLQARALRSALSSAGDDELVSESITVGRVAPAVVFAIAPTTRGQHDRIDGRGSVEGPVTAGPDRSTAERSDLPVAHHAVRR